MKTPLPIPPRVIEFTATKVDCSEALGYEIVQVIFDTLKNDADEEKRASPYLMLNVNFEFEEEEFYNGVQLEFHDGHDYDGGYSVSQTDLWRDRVRVIAKDGPSFEVGFKLSEKAFKKLRRFLKILFRADCFRE